MRHGELACSSHFVDIQLILTYIIVPRSLRLRSSEDLGAIRVDAFIARAKADIERGD
jgi:hypothetical protein